MSKYDADSLFKESYYKAHNKGVNNSVHNDFKADFKNEHKKSNFSKSSHQTFKVLQSSLEGNHQSKILSRNARNGSSEQSKSMEIVDSHIQQRGKANYCNFNCDGNVCNTDLSSHYKKIEIQKKKMYKTSTRNSANQFKSPCFNHTHLHGNFISETTFKNQLPRNYQQSFIYRSIDNESESDNNYMNHQVDHNEGSFRMSSRRERKKNEELKRKSTSNEIVKPPYGDIQNKPIHKSKLNEYSISNAKQNNPSKSNTYISINDKIKIQDRKSPASQSFTYNKQRREYESEFNRNIDMIENLEIFGNDTSRNSSTANLNFNAIKQTELAQARNTRDANHKSPSKKIKNSSNTMVEIDYDVVTPSPKGKKPSIICNMVIPSSKSTENMLGDRENQAPHYFLNARKCEIVEKSTTADQDGTKNLENIQIFDFPLHKNDRTEDMDEKFLQPELTFRRIMETDKNFESQQNEEKMPFMNDYYKSDFHEENFNSCNFYGLESYPSDKNAHIKSKDLIGASQSRNNIEHEKINQLYDEFMKDNKSKSSSQHQIRKINNESKEKEYKESLINIDDLSLNISTNKKSKLAQRKSLNTSYNKPGNQRISNTKIEETQRADYVKELKIENINFNNDHIEEEFDLNQKAYQILEDEERNMTNKSSSPSYKPYNLAITDDKLLKNPHYIQKKIYSSGLDPVNQFRDKEDINKIDRFKKEFSIGINTKERHTEINNHSREARGMVSIKNCKDKCNICGSVFDTKLAYLSHQLMEHKKSQDPYIAKNSKPSFDYNAQRLRNKFEFLNNTNKQSINSRENLEYINDSTILIRNNSKENSIRNSKSPSFKNNSIKIKNDKFNSFNFPSNENTKRVEINANDVNFNEYNNGKVDEVDDFYNSFLFNGDQTNDKPSISSKYHRSNKDKSNTKLQISLKKESLFKPNFGIITPVPKITDYRTPIKESYTSKLKKQVLEGQNIKLSNPQESHQTDKNNMKFTQSQAKYNIEKSQSSFNLNNTSISDLKYSFFSLNEAIKQGKHTRLPRTNGNKLYPNNQVMDDSLDIDAYISKALNRSNFHVGTIKAKNFYKNYMEKNSDVLKDRRDKIEFTEEEFPQIMNNISLLHDTHLNYKESRLQRSQTKLNNPERSKEKPTNKEAKSFSTLSNTINSIKKLKDCIMYYK